MMDDLLRHIIGLASSEHNNADNEIISLCLQAEKTRNRSDVAILFGALQRSRGEVANQIWRNFCKDFVSWKIKCGSESAIDSSSPRAMSRPEPTVTHRWIAEMCVDQGARCLSVNFDGLTRQAIDSYLENKAMLGKTVILDSAEKLGNFFGRDSNEPLYAVFKVRGDIFYAMCGTAGCPLQRKETPVYDFGMDILDCTECSKPRNLQIGFPGHYEKEIESEKILGYLWRFIVPSTSAIIILGFSGEWDHAIVEFIFEAAGSQRIPVLDIRLQPNGRERHYIYDIWQREYVNTVKRYERLYGPANQFSEIMRQIRDHDKA